MVNNWPGLAQANLDSGQDLKVTIDYRDLLAEIVQNRLGNTQLDVIFPAWKPTMRGITKESLLHRDRPAHAGVHGAIEVERAGGGKGQHHHATGAILNVRRPSGRIGS